MAIGPIQTVSPSIVSLSEAAESSASAGAAPAAAGAGNVAAAGDSREVGSALKEILSQENVAGQTRDAAMIDSRGGETLATAGGLLDIGFATAPQIDSSINPIAASNANFEANQILDIGGNAPGNVALREADAAATGDAMARALTERSSEAGEAQRTSEQHIAEGKETLDGTMRVNEAGAKMLEEQAKASNSTASENTVREKANAAEATQSNDAAAIQAGNTVLASLDESARERVCEKSGMSQIRGQLTEELVNAQLAPLTERFGSDVIFVPGHLVDDGQRMLTDGVFLRPTEEQGKTIYELVAFVETKSGGFSADSLAEGASVRDPRTGDLIPALVERAQRYAGDSETAELRRVATDDLFRELGLAAGPDDAFVPEAVKIVHERATSRLAPGEVLKEGWFSATIITENTERLAALEAENWDLGSGQIVKTFERLMTANGQPSPEDSNVVTLRLKAGALPDHPADAEIDIRASRQSTLAILAVPADVNIEAVRDTIGERGSIRISSEIGPAEDLRGQGLAIAVVRLDETSLQIREAARTVAEAKKAEAG